MLQPIYFFYVGCVVIVAAALSPLFVSVSQTRDECYEEAKKLSSSPFDHKQSTRFERACTAHAKAGQILADSVGKMLGQK